MVVSKDLMGRFDKIKGSKYFWPITSVLVIVFLAFFIGPKLTGFTVFSSELNECKDDLDTCSDNVDELTDQKTKLETDLAAAQNTIAEREGDIKNLENQHQLDKDSLQQDYDNLANTFNSVVDNAGTNKCCKERVDDEDINSFNVNSEHEIDCVPGGTFSITCPN